jgi:serine/threonine protein phosphatase PrpC
MTLALRYALRSDVGLLREGNEDSAYAGPHLLAIADGMGGHAAGEVASAVAISAMVPLDKDMPDQDMLDALAIAVSSASGTLHEMSVADPAVEGMGTTLTAMLWSGARVALCHIGDSRAYLLRDGELHQITRDHTLVQGLVDEGRMSPAAAAVHPQRSLVTRALQGSSEAEPDLSIREAILGDRYLLCSDGLSDVVSDDTLHKTLMKFADLDEAVLQLIELAIRGGGPDNITCITADVVDTVTGPVAPSRTSVLAGAASNGGGRPVIRTDSPAGRAHLLTQGPLTQGPGQPAQLAQPSHPSRPAQTAQYAAGHRGGQDAGGEEADEDLGKDGPARRRLPVVKSILAVLIIVIAGGGYAGWRYTQSQYYVGADAGQVAIFRGVNQQVAGISLFSVYRRTGIPLSGVPAADSSLVAATILAKNLPDAQRIVLRIRQGYQCKLALAAVAKWQAGKPKPVTTRTRVKGKIVVHTTIPPYRPEPPVPGYCSSLQGVTG